MAKFFSGPAGSAMAGVKEGVEEAERRKQEAMFNKLENPIGPDNPDAVKNMDAAANKARMRRGRATTILTGGSGLMNAASTMRKSLMGG